MSDVPMWKRPLVCKVPEADEVTVRTHEIAGADGRMIALDVYSTAADAPAVIIVSGYPDDGFERVVGCRFKDMQWTVSWAQLLAAAGIAAVAYTNHDPAADFAAVSRTVFERSDKFGIDARRIGVLATSGHVPVALSALTGDFPVRISCAAFCYGYTLDLDGSTAVGDAAKMFRFAVPCAGRSLDDLRNDVPLFIARAGKDETPRLNESLDALIAGTLSRNFPITLINHADAPHAFDMLHDSDMSRHVIDEVVRFFQFNMA